MQDIFVSVRRSLVFKPTAINDDGGGGGGGGGRGIGGFVERIGSSIRKSRVGLFANPASRALPPPPGRREDEAPSIRWRKGELIGCGAFGRVYMGMNLDSGELLAVKQVLIAVNSAPKEKTQEHIRELEEEVKLLRNLSHPNIVRYLGTAREDDSLNILLEFVPGGSISSLLGKFGSFPESVIKMYTKQILLGLEYLHKNKILHRDIKGANILVDNKGCIKLADFGASKKVVELATMTGAKSMKGTPYWMAPEVILQTGHSFSADIWSVGCTVIEMATGKPPWSQQYQEVAALFHIGTTKSHPPIPEHLSFEANDFLLKCLQKEPQLRPDASELLKHPFVTGGCLEPDLMAHNGVVESNLATTSGLHLRNSMNSTMRRSTCAGLKDVCEMDSLRSSTAYPGNLSGLGSCWGTTDSDDDMCQIDDKDEFGINASNAFKSIDVNKSFNPMSEPTDDWPYKLDESTAFEAKGDMNRRQSAETAGSLEVSGNGKDDLLFPCGVLPSEEDDEVTESKIKAFLDDKAFELKKMQTPLYEEFYNTLNEAYTSSEIRAANNENQSNVSTRPPISKSPKRLTNRRLSAAVDTRHTNSPSGDSNRIIAHASGADDKVLHEIQPPQVNAWPDSERQRKWEEELVQELERKRELMRQAGVGGKTSSPKERFLSRHRERLRFPSPGK